MKVSTKGLDNSLGWGSSYVVGADLPDFAVGRMCTFIESLGLKDSQEKAAKDLIRQEIWGWFALDRGALYISGQLSTKIRNVYELVDKADKESPYESNSPIPIATHEGWRFEIDAERIVN